MLSDQIILSKIRSLPENIKVEIINFIEFLIQKYQKRQEEKITPKFGSLKGTFKMTDDFDEPLDEFRDYM